MKELQDQKMRESTFQLQKTNLIPKEGELDPEEWTDEMVAARKAMDLLERQKYRSRGKPKELSFSEKQRFI